MYRFMALYNVIIITINIAIIRPIIIIISHQVWRSRVSQKSATSDVCV